MISYLALAPAIQLDVASRSLRVMVEGLPRGARARNHERKPAGTHCRGVASGRLPTWLCAHSRWMMIRPRTTFRVLAAGVLVVSSLIGIRFAYAATNSNW